MAMRLIVGESIEPKDVTYLFLERHSTPFILGFVVVGLMSALMSSGDSFLNLVSISVVRDFAGWRKGKSLADKKHIHKEIRIAAIIFGLIALGMALILPKIVDLMVVGIATIVIFVPITFLALIKDNVYKYRKVAILSILSGFIVNLFFFTWGMVKPEQFQSKSSFIPAFIIASLLLLLGVYFINKKERG
jgi:sodium/proline symporter/sodium/pantothenate symporter